MKLIIKKKEVVKSFANIQAVTEKSAVIPILSNMLLEAKSDKLKLYATNLKISLMDECPAVVEREGSVALDAKKIFEIIKEAPHDEIILEKSENNWVKITSEKVVYSLAGNNPKEYPERIQIKEKPPSRVVATKIIEMIKKTIFAAAEDESKGSLGGLLWEVVGGRERRLRIVATDAHRLSCVERKEEEGESINEELNNIIVPKKGMLELKRLLEDIEGQMVDLWTEGGNLLVKKEKTLMAIGLIEGEFPDYKRVLSFKGESRIGINAQKLLSAIRRVSIILEERIRTIKILLSPGTIKIVAHNAEIGDASEEVGVDYVGNEREICLNLRYILDSLNCLESEGVFLEVRGPNEPIKILPEKDKDHTLIIMPMVF